MYHDSPESRDVPAHARTGGSSPARAWMAGGLVGGIGVLLVLIVTGAISLGPKPRPAAGPATDTTAVASTSDAVTTDTTAVAAPAELASTDSAATTVTTPTVTYVPPPPPPPPPPQPTTPPPPTAEERVRMYRGALQQAILEADAAEIDAKKSLDPSPLYARYTGAVLQTLLESIESLRGQGLHEANRLVDVQWHSFWVSPDEQSAQVRTTEVWYSEYHRNGSDECAAVVPQHEVPQTARLVRVNGVWKVSSVTFSGATPQPQACS